MPKIFSASSSVICRALVAAFTDSAVTPDLCASAQKTFTIRIVPSSHIADQQFPDTHGKVPSAMLFGKVWELTDNCLLVRLRSCSDEDAPASHNQVGQQSPGLRDQFNSVHDACSKTCIEHITTEDSFPVTGRLSGCSGPFQHLKTGICD